VSSVRNIVQLVVRTDQITRNIVQYVGFKALTTVVKKSFIIWDITPCSLLKVNRLSEEYIFSIFKLQEQFKKETNMKQAAIQASKLCLLPIWFILQP
jgi:hypothetical protein